MLKFSRTHPITRTALTLLVRSEGPAWSRRPFGPSDVCWWFTLYGRGYFITALRA